MTPLFIRRMVPETVVFNVRRLKHAGEGEQCSMCRSKFNAYDSWGEEHEVFRRRKVVGAGKRDADVCPVCLARDRSRLLQLYLEQVADLGGSRFSVLHAAPELPLTRWLNRHFDIEYTATDISPDRYPRVRNMKQANLLDLQFEDESFDVVICSHVLEHIPDDAKAMAELRRVLKSDGLAFLQVPYADDGQGTDEDPTISDPAERAARFGQHDHVRLYDLRDYVARLETAGFNVELFDPFAAHQDVAVKYRLNPDEVLPVCRRS